MDFDEYFRRFRCLDPGCGWMPPSSAEREIRSLQSYTQPTEFDPIAVPNLGLRLTPSYDPTNDAFSVDFGLDEPTFDLPDPDGRMIWRIGRQSNTVAGFTIARAREASISEVTVQFITARKQDIERGLRAMPFAAGRNQVTKDLVERVVVTATAAEQPMAVEDPASERAWKKVVSRLHELTPA
jgi:hypothetical protein